MKPRTPSVDAWLSAGLFAAGSLVFLTGGRQHPQINAQTMPTAGSLEYFRHFAAMVLETPGWETFHSMILAGPLLWAMGAAVGWRLFAKRAAPVADLGKHALLAGAVLWALAFVLDGYVAPRYARAILEAGPDADAAAIATFGANAFTMARLGTISLALMASGIVALSVSLLLTVRAGWRSLVGYAGLLVGAWPSGSVHEHTVDDDGPVTRRMVSRARHRSSSRQRFQRRLS